MESFTVRQNNRGLSGRLPLSKLLNVSIFVDDKLMHICCAVIGRKINIITAYYPDITRWEEDMKTRKAAKK